jgi:hypothetical protein
MVVGGSGALLHWPPAPGHSKVRTRGPREVLGPRHTLAPCPGAGYQGTYPRPVLSRGAMPPRICFPCNRTKLGE